MRNPLLVIGVLVATYLGFSPVFYLVPFDGDTRPLALRIPAAYSLSGREIDCELRAAEMRRAALTEYARCEPVQAWRHWLNMASVE